MGKSDTITGFYPVLQNRYELNGYHLKGYRNTYENPPKSQKSWYWNFLHQFVCNLYSFSSEVYPSAMETWTMDHSFQTLFLRLGLEIFYSGICPTPSTRFIPFLNIITFVSSRSSTLKSITSELQPIKFKYTLVEKISI